MTIVVGVILMLFTAMPQSYIFFYVKFVSNFVNILN